MAKHEILRDYLVTALPELRRNPEMLSVYITGGRIRARLTENLGFAYDGQLSIDVLGFPGDPMAFFLPLVLWLRKYEPAALQNHDIADERIRFDIDVVDQDRVDISVQLPMGEAVDVLPRLDGSGYDMTRRDEPGLVDEEPLADPLALLKRIYANGVLLVGTPPAP